MDAPPDKEDCRPFVRVARLLHEAGVHAPQVRAQDLAQGFLLLTDLGTRTYLARADAGQRAALFADATDALIRWQLATRAGRAAALRRSPAAPGDGALSGLVRRAPPRRRDLRRAGGPLEQVFALLAQSALAQPKVYVHRDYMPRNLMVCEPNPGVLDFQDAVIGPITYDMVSLMRDAFISWDEERVLDWTVRYWEKARARACRSPRTSANSGAPSNGWGCSATSRCSASSRASTTATASRSTSPTRRGSFAMRATVAKRYVTRALARLLDRAAGRP